MSEDSGSRNDETSPPLPQHPLVDRLKPDPSEPARQVTELVGLPGDSDRVGYQRLYLTARLDYYAEFLIEDAVYSETVPPDQSPLPGLEATKIGVRRDTTVSYTWVRSRLAVDEYDLDVRLGGAGAGQATVLYVTYITCPLFGYNNSCLTCGAEATCANTCPNTCAVTCATCNTQCGQETCVNTQCHLATCVATCPAYTCDTCVNTCVPTCGPTCRACTRVC